MRIIKAGLKRFTPSQLIGKSIHVEERMTGNVHFATPSPALVDVTAARTALVTAIADATSGAHAAIASKNVAAKKLSNMLVQLARYVNSVAGSDVDVAVSSGFDLSKMPDPIDKLEAPTKLEGVRGSITGQIALRWKGVRGGRLYNMYICDGNPAMGGKWSLAGTSSKAKQTVTGLETDKMYSFKVAALGVVGEGPMSEVVMAKAA